MENIKMLCLMLVISCVLSQKMIVTKAYTDYLIKHVTWDVVDYEDNIYRGWTTEEATSLLTPYLYEEDLSVQTVETSNNSDNFPSSLSWKNARCDHGVMPQGLCAGGWAIATAGMLSDRACLEKHEYGWLSPQELISCDTDNQGCDNGWPSAAIKYVKANRGLVPNVCYPYKGIGIICNKTCEDGKKDWKQEHVGTCGGNYISCLMVEGVKSCLRSGPVTATMGVCQSFYYYMSGVYHCDCGNNYMGLHSVLIMGYASTKNESYWDVRNSWDVTWGNKGYFQIEVKSCGIHGLFPKGNVACLHVI